MKQGLWFGLMFLILGGPVQAQSDFLGHLGHVVDNADLLTVGEELRIARKLEARVRDADLRCLALLERDQRVVVVSVGSLNGKSIENMPSSWGSTGVSMTGRARPVPCF